MRIQVDTDLCVGHGRCYALAPDVFAPDDVGHCDVLMTEVDGSNLASARTAAANCPEQAISLVAE